jgi:hypothetical protein
VQWHCRRWVLGVFNAIGLRMLRKQMHTPIHDAPWRVHVWGLFLEAPAALPVRATDVTNILRIYVDASHWQGLCRQCTYFHPAVEGQLHGGLVRRATSCAPMHCLQEGRCGGHSSLEHHQTLGVLVSCAKRRAARHSTAQHIMPILKMQCNAFKSSGTDLL